MTTVTEVQAPSGGATRWREVLWALGLVILAAVMALMGIPYVRETTALFELGQSANPYFLPQHLGLLYIATPLATLGAAAFFMAPGLLLAASYGRAKGAAYWMLAGFGASVLILSLATMVVQGLTGVVLKGGTFWLVVAGVTALCLLAFVRRVSAGDGLRLALGPDRTDLWVGVVLFIGCLILLSPKFYWENFTGDGHGSLKFARLFIYKLWPFWMPDAGTIAKAPGLSMVLFVIPESWFVRLWGEAEYSVRAPMLLYLAIAYPVVTGLIRWGRDAVIGVSQHLLILGAFAVYCLTMIYSGGYNPYFGDSPMPAARETLALAVFLGYVLALADVRVGMMIPVAVMASITIPTGGLWLGMVAVAAWLVWTPRNTRRTRASLAVVGIALLVSVVVPKAIDLFGLYYPGENEFGVRAIVNRLRYVSFTDWQRLLFVVIPCGIVPFVALLAWSRQDRLSRTLTLASLGFFLFFYFQGYRVLLHHFAPIMLVPVVVFWRSQLLQVPALATLAKPAAAVGIAVSLWLAWPAEMRMHDFDRKIGGFIETSGPRFENGDRAPGDVYRGFNPRGISVAHLLLTQLFPIGFNEKAANERFYGAPLVWWYYSEHPKPEGQLINYRVKPLADATPEDGTLFAKEDEYGLFIKDMALYESHRTTVLPTNTGAQVFVVSRDQMFGGGATRKNRTVIDVVAVVRGLIGK